MGKRREGAPRLTLLVVPEGERGVRSICVPGSLARRLPAAGVALALLGAFLAISYLGMARNQWELTRLRRERAAQETRLRSIEAKARAVEEHLRSVDDLEGRVRTLLGEKAGATAAGGKDAAAPRGGRAVSLSSRGAPRDLSRALDAGCARLAGAERLLSSRLSLLSAVPSTPPGVGPITSRFGVRRSPFGRRSEFHDGLDLDLPYGAPVRAAAAGLVVSAGPEPGYGLTVTLRHSHGFTSRYGHLSAFTVSAGQHVERGDVVGRVGSTGRSTGPHLHFMVLRDGQAQDPLDYLVR